MSAALDGKRRHLYALIGALDEPAVDRLQALASDLLRAQMDDETRVRNLINAGLAELRANAPRPAPSVEYPGVADLEGVPQ